MLELPRAQRPSLLAVVAATLAGNLFLVAGTLAFAAAALVAAFVPPRGRLYSAVARSWARSVLAASFVRLEIEREVELDPQGRYVFMANHQSLFDIPALLASLPGQTRFLAKRSLFRIPLFGWALAAGGFVPVDREDRSTARESLASAITQLARGVSVLIFPEEMRSLDGRLLPFQRGGFLLALKSGLPIVPVGIAGALQVQSRRSFLIRPRPVRVRYGRPIEVAGTPLGRLGELTEEVRGRVAELAGTERSAAAASTRRAARRGA